MTTVMVLLFTCTNYDPTTTQAPHNRLQTIMYCTAKHSANPQLLELGIPAWWRKNDGGWDDLLPIGHGAKFFVACKTVTIEGSTIFPGWVPAAMTHTDIHGHGNRVGAV
jgi:hypothetical protein